MDTTTHSPSAPPGAVSEHAVEEARKHIRTYLIVGFALLCGTIMTVWASLINFHSREINIAVALTIACTKGFLVAGFFMHLISERKMIYAVLSFTVFFFSALMYLTLYSMADGSIVHIR
ncbi:MAG: cytochrome C oxidase subunit IV family protein [Verrucomicrobiota bacterium]|jgi:caa(3)-type oxidase subunit IV